VFAKFGSCWFTVIVTMRFCVAVAALFIWLVLPLSAQESGPKEAPLQELFITSLPYIQLPGEVQLTLRADRVAGATNTGGAFELGLGRGVQLGVELAPASFEEENGARPLEVEAMGRIAGEEDSRALAAFGLGAFTQLGVGRQRASGLGASLSGLTQLGPILGVTALEAERQLWGPSLGDESTELSASLGVIAPFHAVAWSGEVQAGVGDRACWATGLTWHILESIELASGLIAAPDQRRFVFAITWEAGGADDHAAGRSR
jgi:hypothetical protein